jgi:hypothetical protein
MAIAFVCTSNWVEHSAMRLAFTDNGIWAAEITASVVRHDFMWMLKKSTGTRAKIYIIVVLSCKVITSSCEYILEATAQSGNETGI